MATPKTTQPTDDPSDHVAGLHSYVCITERPLVFVFTLFERAFVRYAVAVGRIKDVERGLLRHARPCLDQQARVPEPYVPRPAPGSALTQVFPCVSYRSDCAAEERARHVTHMIEACHVSHLGSCPPELLVAALAEALDLADRVEALAEAYEAEVVQQINQHIAQQRSAAETLNTWVDLHESEPLPYESFLRPRTAAAVPAEAQHTKKAAPSLPDSVDDEPLMPIEVMGWEGKYCVAYSQPVARPGQRQTLFYISGQEKPFVVEGHIRAPKSLERIALSLCEMAEANRQQS